MAAAEVVRDAAVRVLPLDDFESMEIVALWSGEPAPLVRALLAEAQRYVKQQWPDWVSAEKLG